MPRSFRIRRLAMQIEPDRRRLIEWWNEDGIEELAGLTSAQLLALGEERRVEDFLREIIRGGRG
jgi:hypothetical protein